MGWLASGPAKMAATNKCLAQSNKSHTGVPATNSSQIPHRVDPLMMSRAARWSACRFLASEDCAMTPRKRNLNMKSIVFGVATERQPRMIQWYIRGLTVLYFGTLVSSVNAADMRVERSADSSRSLLIVINGDIVSGDYAKFKKIADRLPYGTVVIMTSRGGLL